MTDDLSGAATSFDQASIRCIFAGKRDLVPNMSSCSISWAGTLVQAPGGPPFPPAIEKKVDDQERGMSSEMVRRVLVAVPTIASPFQVFLLEFSVVPGMMLSKSRVHSCASDCLDYGLGARDRLGLVHGICQNFYLASYRQIRSVCLYSGRHGCIRPSEGVSPVLQHSSHSELY